MEENQTLITSREALENIAEGDYLIHSGQVIIYTGILAGNLNFIFKNRHGLILKYNLPEENISFTKRGIALFKQNLDDSFNLNHYPLIGEERRRIKNLLSQAGL